MRAGFSRKLKVELEAITSLSISTPYSEMKSKQSNEGMASEGGRGKPRQDNKPDQSNLTNNTESLNKA